MVYLFLVVCVEVEIMSEKGKGCEAVSTKQSTCMFARAYKENHYSNIKKLLSTSSVIKINSSYLSFPLDILHL